jgi:dolichyl-phosphate-mannose--protein O-mannosyl transferase
MEILTPIFSFLIKKLEELWKKWRGDPIKYRDTILLRHGATRCSLHSHDHKYTHFYTSGQQQVTAVPEPPDGNDFWIVKGPHGQPELYKDGQSVENGHLIRLQHLNTRRNLHSHGNAPSPLTGQQEVTAYEHEASGDSNDNWRVEVEGGGIWTNRKRIKLIHIETGHALHSHPGVSEYTAGQQEVTCYKERDDNDWWIASQ